MCLLCEQEAFFQAYMDYVARKQAGAADDASAFKAEAVGADGRDVADLPVAEKPAGDKAQST